jgi:hypothetical protein
MANKQPILIWRLKDVPPEILSNSINFWDDKLAYQKWVASKTGNEFVVMIPDGWLFDDADAAHELGLNVTEEMRGADFSGPSHPDCELIGDVHYKGADYNAYVIPALTARVTSQE